MKTRAAIIERRGVALRLEEVDLAEPGRGEVRVKIEACVICRSDLHAIDGGGLDLIADGVAGSGLTKNFALLAPFGKIVLYGAAGGLPGDVTGPMLANFFNSPALVVCSEMSLLNHCPDEAAKLRNATIKLYFEGKIHPRIHARLPLARAARAHEMLESRTMLGRIILVP